MTFSTRLDPLTVLLDLLADHGLELDPDALQANTSPAGHLPRPLRDSGDLGACQIGACERLLTPSTCAVTCSAVATDPPRP